MADMTYARAVHGPVRTAFGGRMKFWARCGMIQLVNQVTGATEILSPSKFEARLNDFIDFYKTCSAHGNGREKDWRWLMRPIMDSIVAVLKEARAQGDPTDPRTRAWHERHYKAGTVSVSQHNPTKTRTAMANEYPELAHMPGVAGCSLKKKPAFMVVGA